MYVRRLRSNVMLMNNLLHPALARSRQLDIARSSLTRRLCELERRARADGVRVLSGECVDLGESELAYAPIVAALRPLARSSDPVLDALPANARAALDA